MGVVFFSLFFPQENVPLSTHAVFLNNGHILVRTGEACFACIIVMVEALIKCQSDDVGGKQRKKSLEIGV